MPSPSRRSGLLLSAIPQPARRELPSDDVCLKSVSALTCYANDALSGSDSHLGWRGVPHATVERAGPEEATDCSMGHSVEGPRPSAPASAGVRDGSTGAGEQPGHRRLLGPGGHCTGAYLPLRASSSLFLLLKTSTTTSAARLSVKRSRDGGASLDLIVWRGLGCFGSCWPLVRDGREPLAALFRARCRRYLLLLPFRPPGPTWSQRGQASSLGPPPLCFLKDALRANSREP